MDGRMRFVNPEGRVRHEQGAWQRKREEARQKIDAGEGIVYGRVMNLKQIKVVVLTGAGISAESGVATFRAQDGLWEGHRIEDVACPEGFVRNPRLVHEFYNMRRAGLARVEPNAAHVALAKLEQRLGADLMLITQNVDDLHERGGSRRVLHMHGELKKARCEKCGWAGEWLDDLTTEVECPKCARAGGMRPDIVWFGEMPKGMDLIESWLEQADYFVSIGTSGHVYPAAGFAAQARAWGATTIEINNAQTQISNHFDQLIQGPASVEVPKWVEESGLLSW